MFKPGLRWTPFALAAAIVCTMAVVRAEERVAHTAVIQGPATQVAALPGFDPARGELLRVRLTVTGTASGAVARYGALGKKFTYHGQFALSPTANFDPDGFLDRIEAYGVDRAPPSPDSLSAVDWHVAVYGNVDRSSGFAAFAGSGPVYLLYTGEDSTLSIRGEGHDHSRLTIGDSTLEAQATIHYYYRPDGSPR